MSFVKDKSSIKYYILALVCVVCVYSSQISKLFIPVFDNIYYGNLVDMFVALTSMIIWLIEFLVIFFVCKKLGIHIFTDKEKRKQELPLWRVIVLFIAVLIPIFIISAYLNFKVKLVYSLGIRVTSVGLACNACEILATVFKILLIIMFIHFIHLALDKNFKCKNEKIQICWGAIFSFLIFGLIDFFCFPVDLNWFYLISSFWYGIVYLLANRKFSTTFILSYIIWLL